ncbi:uncharacterized protein [Solanum lycopersicum]|uniref:uncharacterized protein n=1 Tax=Solanum lycopersicum TaxID=4081 RepID=UPI0037482840
MEFAYNNSYHSSIQMAPYEALCGRICRSPIGWFGVGEVGLIGTNLVHQAMKKEKEKAVRVRINYWVYLKVSTMNGVMRSGKKGKLSPQYIDKIAYELKLPQELGAVHPVFHVSMLKKCMGDPSLIIPIENIGVKDSLSYEEIPVQILNC